MYPRARDGKLTQPTKWCGSVTLTDYPSMQNILDGCFGREYDHFAKIVDRAYMGTMTSRRRTSGASIR